MKIIYRVTIIAAVTSLLFGCASTIRENPTIKLDTKLDPTQKVNAYIANTDATRTLSYVTIDADGNIRMLSGVPPEAVITSVTEIMAKLKYDKLDAEATAKFTENLTVLGKRTVAVSVLMNALYRLHEMGLNNKINDDVIKMFDKVIDATVTIAQAEEQTARSQASAEANKLIENIKSLDVDKSIKTRILLNVLGIKINPAQQGDAPEAASPPR